MKVEEVKKYVGREVLIVLHNGFKFTVIIPEFSGDSFRAIDKYNKSVTVECESISMVYDKKENGGKNDQKNCT